MNWQQRYKNKVNRIHGLSAEVVSLDEAGYYPYIDIDRAEPLTGIGDGNINLISTPREMYASGSLTMETTEAGRSLFEDIWYGMDRARNIRVEDTVRMSREARENGSSQIVINTEQYNHLRRDDSFARMVSYGTTSLSADDVTTIELGLVDGITVVVQDDISNLRNFNVQVTGHGDIEDNLIPHYPID